MLVVKLLLQLKNKVFQSALKPFTNQVRNLFFACKKMGWDKANINECMNWNIVYE